MPRRRRAPRARGRSSASRSNGPRATAIGLIGLPRTRARIDRPADPRGRAASAAPARSCSPRGWARDHGVAPSARIDRRAATAALRVVGIGVDGGLDRRRLGRPGRRARAGASERPRPVGVALRLRDPGRRAGVRRAASSATASRTLDWRTQRAQLTDDSRRLLTILQRPRVLALLAAAFTLATAIGGRVIASRRQIGLLRAIGLTPAQVTGVLVAHYLVLAALAAPLGLARRRADRRRGCRPRRPTRSARPRTGAPGAALLAGSLLIALLVVAAATALPAWRAGRMPAQAALAHRPRGDARRRASRVARDRAPAAPAGRGRRSAPRTRSPSAAAPR